MEGDSQIQMPLPLASSVPPPSVGEAYINGVYDGLSFHSLLTYDPSGQLQMPDHTVPLPHTPPFNFFSESSSSSNHLLSLGLPKSTVDVSSQNTTLPPRLENPKRRKRQQKLSDKTRCLQKLLPGDKKMDMATVLEEAYKYIKFLQAQVSILQSMPYQDCSGVCIADHGADHLWRLNRQQLLQVLLHSPMAQTLLYSQGRCVYSLEQLVLFIDPRPV